jgi:hypothetical protein
MKHIMDEINNIEDTMGTNFEHNNLQHVLRMDSNSSSGQEEPAKIEGKFCNPNLFEVLNQIPVHGSFHQFR